MIGLSLAVLYLFDPNSRSDQLPHMVSIVHIDPQTGVANRSKVSRYLGTSARAGILVVGLISRWILTMFDQGKNNSLTPSKAIVQLQVPLVKEYTSQHKNGAC